MKYIITLLLVLGSLISSHAQETNYVKTFEHFRDSRGNSEEGLILTLPKQEMVKLERQLNSKSGLGPTFNYYGTVVVVDKMDVLPNGNYQMVLRREDGKDFYGYRPTIKAVLVSTKNQLTLN